MKGVTRHRGLALMPPRGGPVAAVPSSTPTPRALVDYDVQNVLTAPPKQRLVVWLIVGLVAFTAVALAVLKVDIVISANGKIVTSDSEIVIQPVEMSVVRSVAVKMGQQVNAGDILATLDPTFTEADRDELTAKLRKGKKLGGFKERLDMPDDDLTLDYIFDNVVIRGSVNRVVDGILELHEKVGDFGVGELVIVPHQDDLTVFFL